MPRRDLTEERTTEILDAFERCVARDGLEKTSMEDIAREAGMKRSILRHYIGNRDAIVLALAERVVGKNLGSMGQALAMLPHDATNDQILNLLFRTDTSNVVQDVLVIEKLIDAAQRNEAVGRLITQWLESVVHDLSSFLQRRHTSAAGSKCHDAAWGIICVIFNWESFLPVGLTDEFRHSSRRCCEIFLESLE